MHQNLARDAGEQVLLDSSAVTHAAGPTSLPVPHPTHSPFT